MVRSPEATRERILGAARECFQRYGFKKTSVDEVAHAAGVGKGTIYLHFKDKDDMFVAVVRQLTGELDQAAVASLNEEPDALGKCLRMLRNVVGFVAGQPLMAEIMSLRLDPGLARLQPILAECREGALAALEEILREGVRAGEVAHIDTRLAAFVMYSVYEAYYLGNSPGGRTDYVPTTPEEFVGFIAQLTRQGIAGPRSTGNTLKEEEAR